MSTTNKNKFWISLLWICCPFLCVRNRNGRGLECDLDIWVYCSFYQLLNYYHFTEITSEREACVFKSKDSKWITFAKTISNFSKQWAYIVPLLLTFEGPRYFITIKNNFVFTSVLYSQELLLLIWAEFNVLRFLHLKMLYLLIRLYKSVIF